LRGIYFARSISPRDFYTHVFVLPLCVPTPVIGFNFGWRVGGGSHFWNADAPNITAELGAALKREALPFLSRIQSPRDVAEAGMSLRKSADRHVQEAIAYTLARAGDVDKAIAELDALLAMLDVVVPWQLEMAERANLLKSQLLSEAPSAQKQLEAWEAETTKSLRLEKFRQ
jgi:predicted RNA-binding Zn ribbon-like protein